MKIPSGARGYATEVYLARGEVLSAAAVVVFGDVGVGGDGSGGGGGDGNNIIIYKNNTMMAYTIYKCICYI